MALDAIVAHKRREVASGVYRTGHDLTGTGGPKRQSLADALSQPEAGFILECKKASPSRGCIRSDFDVLEIARAYAPYANAISVLTDERFFGGSLEHLRRVRKAVSLPLLCKDFIVDPVQVKAAALMGADAVLLMLSILNDREYGECMRVVESMEIEAVTEVHDEHELKRAVHLGAKIVGINNRNLHTLEVDTATTVRLAPLAPVDRVLLGESGVTGSSSARELSHLVDGLLVGSALMEHPDVSRATRELIFGRVKICGLTSAHDARAARSAGAVYGGLIFAEESPRCIDSKTATGIVSAASLLFVGVFVNQPVRQIARLARDLGLAAVQLHGDEDQVYTRALKQALPEGCEIWKSVPVVDGKSIPLLDVDRVLLDTHHPDKRGGSGRTFDWTFLHGRDNSTTIVSGGVSRANIHRARSLEPHAVDVCSGVESGPRQKNSHAMGHLMEAARGVSRVRS